MFYQNEPYFTGDKIKILKPKFKEFNQDNAQFFLTAMEKSFSSFSWGSSSFNVKIIENQTLKIPVKDGKPDFDFMGSFIAELEAERIAELEAYLEVTGLSDCKLTEDEQKALDNYGSLTFEDFSITDVFDIKNTKNILSRDITPNSGTVPYLCASADDNAISSYISYDKRLLDKGDCIFIGGKTFVVTYQEYDFFSNDSHNLALTLKNNDYRSKLSQIYLSTCVRKSLSHKYSWGDSISNRKIQKDNIRLPSARKKVDYSSMELLISAIQKIVIKDVVVYADKKIQAHKEVIHS
ncbi:restriction endonuclease subunit S [Vibrio anguillarum]|nr:restriction endonuclease subunit S [Vibrio anguillarum]